MEDTLRGRINSFMLQLFISLNPCFNGRYSQSDSFVIRIILFMVLILVLMEDTLRDGTFSTLLFLLSSLNPCFNGRYSQRTRQPSLASVSLSVLILVLMEDTLRVTFTLTTMKKKQGS